MLQVLFLVQSKSCACRALCYLKLEMFTEAKQDCDAALNLEPTNKKAFYRRALASKGLKVNRATPNAISEHAESTAGLTATPPVS